MRSSILCVVVVAIASCIALLSAAEARSGRATSASFPAFDSLSRALYVLYLLVLTQITLIPLAYYRFLLFFNAAATILTVSVERHSYSVLSILLFNRTQFLSQVRIRKLDHV